MNRKNLYKYQCTLRYIEEAIITTQKTPIITPKKAYRVAGTVRIGIPMQWFRDNGIPVPTVGKPVTLMLLANSHIKILNPNATPALYEEVSKKVEEPITEEETETSETPK